jgi:hypothetical protein
MKTLKMNAATSDFSVINYEEAKFVITLKDGRRYVLTITPEAVEPAPTEQQRPPSEPQRSAASAKAELDAILQRRPDLKGKSPEAAKRILRREARLSAKPLRSRS